MTADRSIDRCLIVGAGMAGLTAARLLKENAITPIVLEKSKGVGGRMATRRIEKGVLDHGAQFLTARDARFQKLVAEWEARGVLREWCQGFPSDTGPRLCDGHTRYKAVGGMTALAKHVARDLDVHLNTPVTAIRSAKGRWNVGTGTGESFEADALILTPPVPQALEIMEVSALPIPKATRDLLAGIHYDPCMTLLALLEHPSAIPDPGGMRFSDGPVAFLADNHRKGISPDALCVTIQSSAEFAKTRGEDSDEAVARSLLIAVEKWVDASTVRAFQVKRWRYSMPLELYPDPCLLVLSDPPLILAGDAFGGPRVEGAALSGLAAAGVLLGVPIRTQG